MSALERDSWTVSDDLATIVFNEDTLRRRFYNDCTDGILLGLKPCWFRSHPVL
ncbi:MAG: hypothetical protein CM1200mP27_09300 [Chloroflexota bacterium]|nr:MAG: hypothetical protein CM1200mP27_09300 [Chloroflexota bacterium]